MFSFSYDNEPVYDEIPQTSLLPILAYHNRLLMKHFAVALMIKTVEYKLLCTSDGTEVLSITQECSNFFTALTVQALSLTVKKVSFWYNENGISIAKGTSAKTSTATHLTWEQAAVRIRELLDVGRYMPQYELDKVDDYELNKVADRLTEFIRDLSDDYPNKDNCLQSIQKEIDGVFGYPDMVEKIINMLKDDESVLKFFKEYGN